MQFRLFGKYDTFKYDEIMGNVIINCPNLKELSLLVDELGTNTYKAIGQSKIESLEFNHLRGEDVGKIVKEIAGEELVTNLKKLAFNWATFDTTFWDKLANLSNLESLKVHEMSMMGNKGSKDSYKPYQVLSCLR